MLVEFSEKELEEICQYVNSKVLEAKQMEIEIFKMHCIVENALETLNPKVAKSYRNYRDYSSKLPSKALMIPSSSMPQR